MPLTDTILRNLKSTEHVQKKFDGGGLYIHISVTGGKLWRLAYRFGGKQKTLYIGSYPAISLKDARQKRDEAKELLAKGIDPVVQRKAVKAAVRAEETNSFEVIAREWHNKHKNSWKSSHSDKILVKLEKDIFPIIGAMSINDITAPKLLDALRRIEARGAIETAHRAKQNCGCIFRYAISTGRSERNVVADLLDALPTVKSKHFATITEPKAVGQLLRDIDAYDGHLIIKTALRISPYLFVRPGELRQAEWIEFDFDNAEWHIPAERMKMEQKHIVPLAR